MGTFLRSADLIGADLTNTDFTGADLSGADLAGEDLTDVFLDGTEWPEERPAPEGWVRDPRSGQLSRAGADAHDSG